jgi:NAD(P)-dependent dehydrogenase (short-subunit alcohol dehydrogenase family)
MLDGKVIVVTGGFGTLGRAVALGAASRGARVAVIDFAPTPPENLSVALESGGLLIPGTNLAEPDGAEAAFASVFGHFQRIDALVNVAGGFRWQTVGDGDLATWRMLFTINVETALNASKAAIPHLRAAGGGSIVNVGANGAVKAGVGMGAYAASKAAVHRLTESLAEELKTEGVRVNAVLPSIIDTAANRLDMPNADFSAWVSPEELTNVILFLVSAEASGVTGALIPVTGRV